MDEAFFKLIDPIIDLGFKEDINTGDLTTDLLIAKEERTTAVLIAKADGIIAGLPLVEYIFKKLDKEFHFNPNCADGDKIMKGEIIATFSGAHRAILTGERLALNFLQRLSGIATETAKYVEATKGTKTVILDTRKTIPGHRLLDKYAVKKGGGTNHRMGLFDMVMIKDNHIEVAGGIKKAVEAIRPKINKSIKIEVETTNLQEVQEAIDAGADIIMLDNMDNKSMTKAVQLIGNKAKTEASGNMTLERIQDVAKTGVDFISIGALTHSVLALDISQKIVK